MAKIGLLLDSTTLTREEILKKPYVKAAPLSVTLDGRDYTEFEISLAEMSEKLHTSKKMTTSQPAPGEFFDRYKAFYEEGYEQVLVITLSEKISGTYQSALIAKSMVDFPLEISVHASRVASFGVALGIPIIMNMIEKEAAFDDIIAMTQKIYENAAVMFTLQDLMHLFRGGRLNKVSALLGTVLRIKPIIEMIDGKLELTRKERTNNACFEYFMNTVQAYAEKYEVVYVDFIEMNRPEWVEKMVAETKARFPKVIISTTHAVSPVFSVHLGDQGFGLAVVAL